MSTLFVSDSKNGFINFWTQFFPNPLGTYTQQVNKYGELWTVLTSVDKDEIATKQMGFTLYQNYPNPFNATTTITENHNDNFLSFMAGGCW